jgi:hypothetical protein
MKRVQALITYSLLGSVWLAACGGSNKKAAPPFEAADGGEAGATVEPRGGAPSAGAGNRSGAGGGGAAGEVGQATIEAGSAGEGGSAGDGSLAGAGGTSAGSAGAGGEGGALACFDDLSQAGAPNGVEFGTAGAGSAFHIGYSCNAIRDTLSPSYDPTTGHVTLDVGSLAATLEAGSFTARYSYYTGIDGEEFHDECHEGRVEVIDNLLVLPTEAPSVVNQVRISALAFHDQCGNEAAFDSLSETSSDCLSMEFFNNGEGGWQVDCYEGTCQPACGVIDPLPTSSAATP